MYLNKNRRRLLFIFKLCPKHILQNVFYRVNSVLVIHNIVASMDKFVLVLGVKRGQKSIKGRQKSDI